MRVDQFERLPHCIKEIVLDMISDEVRQSASRQISLIGAIVVAFRTQLWELFRTKDHFSKIDTIRLVRNFTHLGLKESKEMVERHFIFNGDLCGLFDVEALINEVRSEILDRLQDGTY